METLLKLYEEVDQYQVVLDWIEEHEDQVVASGGELPPELEALLEEVQGRVEEKFERTGLVIRNLLANAKAIADEVERLQTRKRVLERQAAGLKLYLKFQLERLGTTRIDGPNGICPVRLQTNGGKPSVTVRDPEKAAPFFVQPPPVFDAGLALQEIQDRIPKGPGEWEIEEYGITVSRGTHVRIG